MYYVYQYLDPFTKVPLYIGKGTGNRLNWHWEAICKNKCTTNKHWTHKLRQMRDLGCVPIIEKIVDNISSKMALQIESEFIVKYGRRDYDKNGTLYNQLVSGHDWTGAKHTAESKTKIGNAHRGKKLEPWHIAAIKQANIGAVRSEETRKKMSDAQKGRIFSQETKDKMSIAARSRPRSLAQQAIFAEAVKKAHAPEARQKAAEKMRGKKHSPETKAKMKRQAIARWAAIKSEPSS